MGLLTLSKKDIESKVIKVKEDPDIYFTFSKRCRRNHDILQTLIACHPRYYQLLSEAEKELVTTVMVVYSIGRSNHSSDILKVFDDRNNNSEICIEAVKASPLNMRYINSDVNTFRSILFDIIDNVRLKISDVEKGWFDRLRKDKSQYVHYIPTQYIDDEMMLAIERAAIHSIEVRDILIEVGYGTEIPY